MRLSSLEVQLERRSKLCTCPVKKHPLMRLGDVENVTDVVRRKSLDVAHHNDHALIGRQLIDRGAQTRSWPAGSSPVAPQIQFSNQPEHVSSARSRRTGLRRRRWCRAPSPSPKTAWSGAPSVRASGRGCWRYERSTSSDWIDLRSGRVRPQRAATSPEPPLRRRRAMTRRRSLPAEATPGSARRRRQTRPLRANEAARRARDRPGSCTAPTCTTGTNGARAEAAALRLA
jgi:hypothetical protein